jgi:hypothetical protein
MLVQTVHRVSHLAAFARWKEMDDVGVDWLINNIRSDEQTEEMAKGTAFHKFLEHVQAGEELAGTVVDGYTFAFVGDFELSLPPTRELRKSKIYDGLIVSGCCDAIAGKTIYDHKTTKYFEAENYLTSWQWKFYLDIFGADRFIWNIWEMNELDEPMSYGVNKLHKLEQFRYPAMSKDCLELAQEFKEFADKWLS